MKGSNPPRTYGSLMAGLVIPRGVLCFSACSVGAMKGGTGYRWPGGGGFLVN